MDYEWVEDQPVQSQTFYNDQRGNRGNRYQNNTRQRNDRFSSGGGAGGSRSWRDRNPSYDNDQRSDNQKQTIRVPSRYVGRIIGKGGSKINDLQFESGCRINVTKEQDGDQTSVVLTGDEKSRQKAEELINDLTVDRERERPSLKVVDSFYESSTATTNTTQNNSTETEFIDWQKLSEECVCIF